MELKCHMAFAVQTVIKKKKDRYHTREKKNIASYSILIRKYFATQLPTLNKFHIIPITELNRNNTAF